MDINDLRNIGRRLKDEISSRRDELRSSASLGKGAGGDTTHPVDKMAEDIVYEEVVKLGEPVTLVSEESGRSEIEGGGPALLVDPIDGSRNAVSGIPLFSTSIALIEGDAVRDTSLGYVINLISGEEFWAAAGQGCFLDGNRIHTQRDDKCSVIAYEAQVPKRDIPAIQPLLSLFDRARCFGSTALDMAFLAAGSVSVFAVPSPSRSFDFAAGYILVREAGGIITDLKGGSIDGVAADVKRSTPLLASANAELHQRALDTLSDSRR